MKSFFYQIGLFMCFALSFGQNVFAQTLNDVNENIVQVVDLIMLQKELSDAASNGEYDIIHIGEGVFDLSLLDQDLVYYPLPLPNVPKEEKLPIMIVGAGAGKTIFDAGGSARKLGLSTAQLKDDMGASITVIGITFRNGGGSSSDHAGLSISTNKGHIEVRDCEFLSTDGSNGSTLLAMTGIKEGLGFIRVISCRFDSLRSTVKIGSSRANAYVEESEFTNFRDYPALDISNNLGVSFISKCKFINNHSIREAPLNANVFSNGTVDVSDCIFENNFGAQSGAVKVSGREAEIRFNGNTLTANSGGKGGGAALLTMEGSGKITVEANLFKENYNNTQGGGLSIIAGGSKMAGLDDSKAFIGIYNNIFSENRTADEGGGVYVETQKGTVEIINNTIIGNTTMAFPLCNTSAGLSLKTVMNEASAVIYNNIFWNNTCKSELGSDLRIDNDPNSSAVGWLFEPDGIGASVLVSNNVVRSTSITISNAVAMENQIIENPLLDSIFNLHPNSPAIDAGTALGHGILDGGKDFTGKARVVDGDGDGKKVVDIGAIEYTKK